MNTESVTLTVDAERYGSIHEFKKIVTDWFQEQGIRAEWMGQYTDYHRYQERYYTLSYCFEDPADATLFLLRWS